jgi:outer membrane protein assembly factor BamB
MVLGVSAVLAGITDAQAQVEDWPTYRHDNRRSGVTAESLTLPLSLQWQVHAPLPPQPAWTGPAKWDSYAKINNIKPMRNFDPVFYTVMAASRIYYGSSVDHAIHCLDSDSGREIWTVFTDGPVRVAPTLAHGRLFAGSDDGHLYCLDPAKGTEHWRYRPAPETRCLANNGQMISTWPCRTGALVQEGIVYTTASLLPWEATYVCALDVQTGRHQGPGLYRETHPHMTAQGPLLASTHHLYISQGRQAPLIIDRNTGALKQSIGNSGFGGVFGLLSEDETFVHGHGQNHASHGELRVFDPARHDQLMTYPKATMLVIHRDRMTIQADGMLLSLQRKRYLTLQARKTGLQKKRQALREDLKKLPDDRPADKARYERDMDVLTGQIAEIEEELPHCVLWRVENNCALELILAGDTLFAGGDQRVAAFDARTGERHWQAEVPGRAYGLTVSHGCLLVSTDRGTLVCFREAPRS